jgi:hypothetical protein
VYANRAHLTPAGLLLKLDELETALQSPNVNGNLVKVELLAVSIARGAPTGAIANLAMKVMSGAIVLRRESGQAADGDLAKTLSDLRSALKATQAPS